MESLNVAVCHDQPLWCKLRTIPVRLSHLLSCNRSASHPVLPFPRFLCKWISQEGQWCSPTPWLPPGVSPSQSKDMQITPAAGYSTWPRGLNVFISVFVCWWHTGSISWRAFPLYAGVLSCYSELTMNTLWLCIVLYTFSASFLQMDNKDLILSLNLGSMPSKGAKKKIQKKPSGDLKMIKSKRLT